MGFHCKKKKIYTCYYNPNVSCWELKLLLLLAIIPTGCLLPDIIKMLTFYAIRYIIYDALKINRVNKDKCTWKSLFETTARDRNCKLNR